MRCRFSLLLSLVLAVGPLSGLSPETPNAHFPNSIHPSINQSDSPPLLPICAIQGAGFSSRYAGQIVRTQGVVYADLDETGKRGFFMQSEICDRNPATSDGIFVYLGARQNLVHSGDLVEVMGTVQEYYGNTEIVAAPLDVRLISLGNTLPVPANLSPPFDNHAAPDYFEPLEGMVVGLDEALVVGPTNASDETWLVRADLDVERVFQDDPLGTGEVICVDDAGLSEITPEVKVGDRVQGILGALEYSDSLYRVHLLIRPIVIPVEGSIERMRTDDAGGAVARRTLPSSTVLHPSSSFSIAAFNLADLFDTVDDPLVDDTVLSAAEYQRRLQKRAAAIHTSLGEPELLAVQEVENRAVLEALIARPEIVAEYELVWVNGPDDRGIDVALLVRQDRVKVLDYQIYQGCTQLLDGLGPDGNRDVLAPQNTVTCDSENDGRLDGNRLFSRPPLVVHLEVCRGLCAETGGQIELWLIVNHLKSKVEDNDHVQYTLPRRSEEAYFLAGLAQQMMAKPGSNLVILGDLNDFPASQPLSILKAHGLIDLWGQADRMDRYSFINQGISETLDYVLVSLTPAVRPLEFAPVHINSDYPAAWEGDQNTDLRSSDHDPLLARFMLADHYVYLPLVSKK